jgi:hypothetical protein
MTLNDTVQLATTTADGYGDKTVTVLTDVKAAFIQRISIDHANNADGITSDAAVYLDPRNDVVNANMHRLEGMYILAQGPQDSWYRISHVTIGQRKLLNNIVDNIYCLLDKEAGVAYAANIS